MELQSGSPLTSQSLPGAPRRSPPRRCPDGGGEDRISALPDDVLLQVLVRLRCARAAALTSSLSRRWRGLWRHLFQLSFCDIALDAVDAALQQVVCPSLSRLEIEIPEAHRIMDPARVSALLQAAARLAPVDLVIDVWGHCKDRDFPIEIPCFERATSIKLRVVNLYLTLPAGEIEFSGLERVSVAGCRFDNMAELIRRCPHLRVLEVCGCSGLGTVKVHSPTIEELVLDNNGSLSNLDIMAPVLEQFTMQATMDKDFNVLFSAPMVQYLWWWCSCEQRNVGIGEVWYLRSLDLWTEESAYILQLNIDFSTRIHVDRDLIQQIAQFPEFSVLEIYLAAYGHVFGAPVLDLLGTCTGILRLKMVIRNLEEHMLVEHDLIQQIAQLPKFSVLEIHLTAYGHVFGAPVLDLLGTCNGILRLKVVIRSFVRTQACPPDCLCDESPNWRSQSIPLMSLEEIEIDGFEGTDHEVDFLKLLFRCAARMKIIIVRLSRRLFPSNRGYKEMHSIFKANLSVKWYVYRSCGQV